MPAAPESHASAQITRLDALIVAARSGTPLNLAVVFPNDERSVVSASLCASEGLATPTLYGDAARIAALMKAYAPDAQLSIVDTGRESAAAARAAVAATATGAHACLLKGSLPTDELLRAVLSKNQGLRAKQRLTHTFLFDLPQQRKLFALTDAAVNVTPTVDVLLECVANAVDVLQSLGKAEIKIAALAASERERAAVPSTILAQQLVSKIANLYGAIESFDQLSIKYANARLPQLNGRSNEKASGVFAEGPLSLDSAMSREAAAEKHIDSRVAGDADLLVALNLDSGSLLYKSLIHFAKAQCAGVVHGAQVPIALVSRVDSVFSRVASVALAKWLYCNAQTTR